MYKIDRRKGELGGGVKKLSSRTDLINLFHKKKFKSHIVLSVGLIKNACNLSENDNLIGGIQLSK